ncbi:DUF6602 domain-containing protein [Streptomyces bluensis]|uniref:DUF6602 domain-containing protein n=1 Tax=Streptomyces bluensis TaxID=33897 RepID=UPI001674C469|nr:DUF6602 domain-containing protein [Streptomyces bluensis]GGZ79696.1 hypothetical protein GCM10010344_53490 [Streptomyces bluensis]
MSTGKGNSAKDAAVFIKQFMQDAADLDDAFNNSANRPKEDHKGVEREYALKQLISKYVRDNVEIHQRAGVQDMASTGTREGWFHEQDVAIVDKRVTPHDVVKGSNQAYVDPSGVLTVIEVKSTLNGEEAVSAMKQIALVQTAPRRKTFGDRHLRFLTGTGQTHYVPISGGIFAYRTTSKTVETVGKWITDWCKGNETLGIPGRPPEEWPKFVTIHNFGHFSWCDPITGRPVPWPHEGNEVLMCNKATRAHHPLVALHNHLAFLMRLWWVPGTFFHLESCTGHHDLCEGEEIFPPSVVGNPGTCTHGCQECPVLGPCGRRRGPG